MQRRRVLVGLAAGGMSLIAGCSSGGGGNNSSNGSSGSNGSTGGSTQSAGGAGTPLTSSDSETTAAATTTIATTTADTARETATQTQSQIQTQTQVQTQTAAPTSMQTATSMMTQTEAPMTSSTSSSSMSTAMGTTGSDMTTGSMKVDLSDRETYTNDTYSYTIEYPAGWSTTDSDPSSVSFSASGAPVSMQVSVSEDVQSSATLESVASRFLSGYKQSAEQDNGSVEIQNRKQVSLSNGNSALLLTTKASVGGVNIQQNILLALANSNIYAAAVTIPGEAYTSTVDQQSTEMLTSLTISSSS